MAHALRKQPDNRATVGLLSQVVEKGEALPRKTLIYGIHGIGKSTFAAASEQPIVIQTEDGLGDITVPRFPLARKYSDVVDALISLYSDTHSYKTVVIDTLDWLERLIWASVCEDMTVLSIEEIPYAKGYVFALSKWQDILDGLDALRSAKNMSVLLLAHSHLERILGHENDHDRYAPKLHKTASALIQEWCSEVLFATYRLAVKIIPDDTDRRRVQGVGTAERYLRTVERPGWVAKNRLGLPEEIPLDYNAYASLVREKTKGE